MTDTAIEAVLRHDRAIVAGALFVLAGLAWAYMLWLAADMDMDGMDMSGFRMIPAGIALMVPTTAPWNATEFAFVFVMWAVMMVGMMTPSATPMILIYARVGRQAAQQGKPFAPSSWFAGGYLLAWVGFALVATFAQWALERGNWLTPKMAAASGVLSGIVLMQPVFISGRRLRTPACGNAGGHCNSFSAMAGFALKRWARSRWAPATAVIA